MILRKHDVGNGIKKSSAVTITAPSKHAPAVKDSTKHTVSYEYHKSHTVLVEYAADSTKDMFQIGRSSEEQIDFTIVDTWLAAGSNMVLSPDRDEPIKVYLYAAGFDSSKNIFLGEKATKWVKKNGESDGLTTNGVLILHPNRGDDEEMSDKVQPEMYIWREVSVDGDIYSLRETRSSTKRGQLVPEETNQLQDGTLIDLCGATLLWRSADGLKKSPSRVELERRLDELNAGRPQCPVNLNTLIVPRRKSARTSNSSRQPYVYMRCGHVQGKHDWGIIRHPTNGDSPPTAFKCPICLTESERVIQLCMGMESAFHLDSSALDFCFNPCGHVASLATVRYWSRIPLPHGTNSFHPVCPFCTSLLSIEKPYVRLIFQDHLFDT
uniref:Pellino n=1 Tax=Acrobeloides nanus TaxID=290746 RepID=A0A914EFH5_9BILA